MDHPLNHPQIPLILLPFRLRQSLRHRLLRYRVLRYRVLHHEVIHPSGSGSHPIGQRRTHGRKELFLFNWGSDVII